MNPFEYASPEKLEDAIALLSEQRGESAVLAGGTDLVTSLKQNLVTPERVVSLKGVSELKGIDTSGEDMRIGAMTSLFDISQNRDIASKFPSLIQAIQGIGSPQIIAMGTIGGDLCQRPRCWFSDRGSACLDSKTVEA